MTVVLPVSGEGIVLRVPGGGGGRLGTQGGAPRLRRFALPWADMLRPLRGYLRLPRLLRLEASLTG
jgi:hypothetical protein